MKKGVNIFYHKNEFKLLSASESVFHNFLITPLGQVMEGELDSNMKYIHPILGYEVVIDTQEI
ncbi:MAG: hypothetical protein IPP74_03230 [Alphaproteobacteria bacterium]|nr:hypothetical protein [Alphaproteobacteria bacterium]